MLICWFLTTEALRLNWVSIFIESGDAPFICALRWFLFRIWVSTLSATINWGSTNLFEWFWCASIKKKKKFCPSIEIKNNQLHLYLGGFFPICRMASCVPSAKSSEDSMHQCYDNYVIVDIGANLTNKKYSRDLDSVIQRAKDAGNFLLTFCSIKV